MSSDTVGPDDFKAVMRHHAKGVSVITAGTRRPTGFCATSLASVSLHPPLLSFSVGLRTRSWKAIQLTPRVMVHLLNDEQTPLAKLFAGHGTDKFGGGTAWHYGKFGLPQLHDVLACLVLDVIYRVKVCDHALVVGRVIAVEDGAGQRPLIHHDGDFISPFGDRIPAEAVGR
jgi:flavin reductase (DIM6/NTAB) family NADH-FMN oxidoreductase RutF